VPGLRGLRAPQDVVRDRLRLPTTFPTHVCRSPSYSPQVRVELYMACDQPEPEGGPRGLQLTLKGVAASAPSSSKRPARIPVSPAMLVALSEHLDLTTHADAAICAAALVAFWGQCRLGGLLGCSKLRFDKTSLPSRAAIHPAPAPDGLVHVELHLPKIKTNQLAGQSVLIMPQLDPINPIKALERHLRVNHSTSDATHLFSFTSGTPGVRHCLTKELFLTRCNDIWARCSLPRVSGHAFRIGGTSTLLRNGVAPDIVRELGRWSSDAYFRYWRDLPAIASSHAAHLSLSAPHQDTIALMGQSPHVPARMVPTMRSRQRSKGNPRADTRSLTRTPGAPGPQGAPHP
jgi:hypothetical protein